MSVLGLGLWLRVLVWLSGLVMDMATAMVRVWLWLGLVLGIWLWHRALVGMVSGYGCDAGLGLCHRANA